MRGTILESLITDKFEPEKFYRAQGQIQSIDDILGLPALLNVAKLREE